MESRAGLSAAPGDQTDVVSVIEAGWEPRHLRLFEGDVRDSGVRVVGVSRPLRLNAR
ncbi:hypothetical protein [Rubrobacter calidifluminis]|uniref:hypothetical protein n=1 Tax=Rubrobacter calidifluminis TaxID=1392640 RepID=UPI0023611779|nr:hypothetical protein [Rubrobacter calidifluminis]